MSREMFNNNCSESVRYIFPSPRHTGLYVE